jgi:hypothetical protein
MNKSPDIKNLAAALAKAQADVEGVAFDSVNPHFKSKYASLAAYLDSMVEPFTKQGLSVTSSVEEGDKGMYLLTLLLHSSGEWIEYKTPMILNKQDMQGLGSAETYARRYRVSAIANVSAEEDDDANLASRPPETRSSAKGAATVVKKTAVAAPTGTTSSSQSAVGAIKMPVTPKLSPDEFILTGKLAGKKIDELGVGVLEDWVKQAGAHMVKSGLDPETSTTDTARSFRSVRKQLETLSPGMFLNGSTTVHGVENDLP